MIIPSYILSSILLSWIGWGVYTLFRWLQPGIKGQRIMVWLVVIASLAIPAFSPLGHYAGTHNHAPQVLHDYQTSVEGFIPPAGQTLNEFCHCTEPQARDVLLYQTGRFYDVIIANTPLLASILLTFIGFFLFRHSLRIWRLRSMVRHCPVEDMVLEGHKVRLVRGFGQLRAGSLRLRRSYIFWHTDLDALSPQEQRAILLHELSHLRQLNTYEKIVFSILQGIWFFNPAFYFFRKELEYLSEFQADSYAARKTVSRKEYAQLLLKVKANADLGLVHFFRKRQNGLRKRIELILKGQPQARMPLVPAIFIGVLLLFSGDMVAQSLISKSIQEIEVYDFMCQAHEETGQEEFCKKCTYEIVCE